MDLKYSRRKAFNFLHIILVLQINFSISNYTSYFQHSNDHSWVALWVRFHFSYCEAHAFRIWVCFFTSHTIIIFWTGVLKIKHFVGVFGQLPLLFICKHRAVSMLYLFLCFLFFRTKLNGSYIKERMTLHYRITLLIKGARINLQWRK